MRHLPVSKLLLLVAVLALTVLTGAWAGSTDGTATAVFLRLPQGGRALGMGSTFVAIDKDVESLWWNPAGTTLLSGPQANLGYSYLIDDMSNSYLAFALPLGDERTSSLMGGINYITMGTVDARDALGNKLSSIEPYGLVVAIGYALAPTSNLSVGFTAKSIQQELGADKGSGLAFDAGLQFRVLPDLMLGVVAQNLGTKLKTDTYENKLPLNLRAGVSYNLLSRVILALDGEKPADADTALHFGTEVKVSETIAVRAGYNTNTAAGFTLGVGLLTPVSLEGAQSRTEAEDWEHNAVRIDYAYVSAANFDATHRLSLTLKL